MRGDESFFNVFQQIFFLGMTEELSWTKEDIENMPPFERLGYIEMVRQHYKDLEEKRKEQEQRNKGNSYK
jgi:hypothetical protein